MAKYIIELDDEYYKQATSNVVKHNMGEMVDAYEIAIANATPIEDATNGEVIESIFSNLKGREKAFEIEVNVGKNKIGNVSEEWWNAPYKKVR